MAGPRPSIWDDGYPPPQAAYPGTRTGRPRTSPYLALLRVGFTEPARSPGLLVRSYRTVSPLPRLSGAVCFLWHFPEGHPWWMLSTTLPCGARTFLPQTMLRAAAQPTPVDISYSSAIACTTGGRQAVGRANAPPQSIPLSMARLAAASAAVFSSRRTWRTSMEPNSLAASFARSYKGLRALFLTRYSPLH